jgi:hypothetical protein
MFFFNFLERTLSPLSRPPFEPLERLLLTSLIPLKGERGFPLSLTDVALIYANSSYSFSPREILFETLVKNIWR